MSVKRSFATHLIPRIAPQLRCSRNPPNIRNPLIYCVNRYFLIFGVSQVQKPYRASTIRLFDLLTLVSYNRKYEIDVQIDFLLKLSYFYCIIHHEKKISSGQGDRNPWKSKFPTGGIVRDPLWRLIW